MKKIFAFIFVIFMNSCTSEPQTSEPKFNSGEHLILGDRGFIASCDSFSDCVNGFARNDGEISYTYGELIAFGGDFYETPEEMFFERKKSFFNFFRNDVSDTKDLFYKEVSYIEDLMHGHQEGEYPSSNVQFAWNFPNYISLAENNIDHFGFHNVIRYVQEHQKAIDMALEAHVLRISSPNKAAKLYEKALFFNGFADHFLTDGFAAGHIRNPRYSTTKWAERNGLNSRDAGILTKILHDRDGEVELSGEHGLPVSNARGDTWFARCDSQLFYNYDMGVNGVNLAAEAVTLSINEVKRAYLYGEEPQGIYQAMELVPFVVAEQASLFQSFGEELDDSDIDAIFKSTAWYFKLPPITKIKPDLIKRYFSELDLIMAEFQVYIQNKIARSPELRKRVPEAYLNAFSKVK